MSDRSIPPGCSALRSARRADELPLWLDSLYVASADPAAAAHAEVFAWVSRDLWMTNVTMHARDDTPAQAIWTDDLTLIEGAPQCCAARYPQPVVPAEIEKFRIIRNIFLGVAWRKLRNCGKYCLSPRFSRVVRPAVRLADRAVPPGAQNAGAHHAC